MQENNALLVVGASSEVGAGIIARHKGRVIAHYNRSKELVDSLPGDVIPVQGDLASIEGIERFVADVAALGLDIDRIVHLPAVPPKSARLRDLDPEAFTQELNVSVLSAAVLCRDFLPPMAKRRFGRVVFMLSSYVVGVPPKFLATYVAAKYALEGLMKAAAVEYADKGVTVNAVAPYMIETKFLHNVADLTVAQSAKSNPTGRNATVADILPAIELLLDDASAYITGTVLPITGGQTL